MSDGDREQPGAMDEEGFTSLTQAVLDATRPPKAVRRMADSIKQAAGRAPEVIRPAPARWQVALAGRRITVTVDFATSLGGKAKWAGSELTVDGKRRPPVAGPAEFGKLWHKLEGRPQRPGLGPVPPMPAGKAVPLDVRIIRDQLAGQTRDQGGTIIETGYEAGAWIVGVTITRDQAVSLGGKSVVRPAGEPDTGLRLVFTRHGTSWGLHGLQVLRDGKDLSARAGHDVAAAIALLSPPPGDAPAARPAGTPSRGARDTGVETRKRVVIREYRRTAGPARAACLREPGAAW